MMKTVTLVIALVGLAVGVGAQSGSSRRDILQREGSSIGGRDVVTAIHEYRGAVIEARHTHPGDLVGYILDGTVSLTQDGREAVPLKAGDTFFVAAGEVHNVASAGSAHILATYIVDKDQPLSVAAR